MATTSPRRTRNMPYYIRGVYADFDDVTVQTVLDVASLKIGGSSAQVGLAGAAMDIPLNQAKVIAAWKDTIADAAGANIMGLSDTEASALVGNAASGNAKNDEALFVFSLPGWYLAGSTITVRVRAKVSVAATASQKVDVTAFKINADAALGSDLCATASQDVTTSYANYDFVITPTSRVPGETVHLRVATLIDDTGGTTGAIGSITKVQVIFGA